MTGERDDVPLPFIASTNPPRPAETTMPIPLAQCRACREDDRHAWSEVDSYRTDRVTLRRLVCRCDMCGRCDARVVVVEINRG